MKFDIEIRKQLKLSFSVFKNNYILYLKVNLKSLTLQNKDEQDKKIESFNIKLFDY